MNYSDQRLAKARTYLKGLDAILLSSRTNVTYVSGYTGSDAVAVFTDSSADLFVDSRNTLQAKEEANVGVRVLKKEVGRDLRTPDRPGCQNPWHRIQCHRSGFLPPDEGPVQRNRDDAHGRPLKYLRSIKDPGEVALISEASRIAEQAVNDVLAAGIIGRKEIDVAFELECGMRRLGASGPSFETIVASGPRSAMPHGAASDRIIRENEPVVFDFGAAYKGYASDQTITVYTGKPDKDFTDVYNHVRKAQKSAMSAVSKGIKATLPDKAARDYLESVGLAQYFGHGLGHGVGMEVHEMPTVSSLSKDILENGMVFTIEPGVYLPGKFGVRIEDMVLITDNSCKQITKLDKDAIKVIN